MIDDHPWEKKTRIPMETQPGFTLHDYWEGLGLGPLHATWQDKPHRLVYDLIEEVLFLRSNWRNIANGYRKIAEDLQKNL